LTPDKPTHQRKMSVVGVAAEGVRQNHNYGDVVLPRLVPEPPPEDGTFVYDPDPAERDRDAPGGKAAAILNHLEGLQRERHETLAKTRRDWIGQPVDYGSLTAHAPRAAGRDDSMLEVAARHHPAVAAHFHKEVSHFRLSHITVEVAGDSDDSDDREPKS